MGTVLGGLYLPQIQPFDLPRTTTQAINAAGGMVNTQTALLALQDAKRQQDVAAAVRQAIAADPAAFFSGGPPQSLIGSLQTAPGGPPGGPMTPQPFGPGGGGPTQTVPAYPDASRLAGVSPQGGGPIPPDVMGQVMPQMTPPQSTIGSLGQPPQPQAQPNPQQRLLELARAGHPEAALKLQALMQGQQDQQWKLEERRLDMGVKVAEGVARELQGVTNQETLDAARERVRLYHPQAAAQIPQFYSKEALDPLIMKGVAVADLAKWRKDMASAQQTQMMTERLPKVFGAMEQFATGGGGTQEPAAGAAPAPGPAAPSAGRDGAAGDWTFQRTEARINEEEAKYPNIPKGLAKAVAYQESEYNPIASGDGGQAKSFFQLHEGAAKDAGIDPARRDDPELNIQGGVKYLSQKITQAGGDIDKALSLYNRGTPDYRGKGDPNYIQNVYKHWQKSSTAGGTGTAQAPATNPRVAQLDADIKRGNALALQVSMIPGMETAAATLRAQVENLTQERTRLLEDRRHQQERSEEIPRAVARTTAETEEKQRLERQRQAGPMLPEDRRKFFTGLRTDIRAEPTFKVYQDVRNGYQNVKVGAASDSAQGDLAIFNGLAKILDPTSSVMSGEARNIEEAQGQLQMWFNSPAKFLEGDRISKDNRPRFLKMAHDLAKEKLTTAQAELKTVYGPLAKEGNIDFEQLVPLADLKPLEPGANVSKLDKLINK